MELIRAGTGNSRIFRRLLAVLLCLAGGMCLYAQSAGQGTGGTPPGTPLGTEIQNLERTLARPGISAVERHETLIRLARLQQLSGNIEGAATNWLAAAAAKPEPDDNALIAGAYCLGALGEWTQAEAILRPLLYSGRQGPVMLHARYLEACARVWRSGESEALIWLANNPEYASLRPAIYYTLWRALESEAAANWKNRLLTEFPRSPEARIAATEGDRAAASAATSATASVAVSAASSPMWLLLPEYSGFVPGPLPSAAPSAPAVSSAQTPAASVTVSPPASPAPSTPAISPPTPGTRVLQTGLFSTEANARAQIEQLRQAGFSAAMSRRIANGAERWAVTVPPGSDINRTIRELKSAGFDSFPVNTQ